MPFDSDLVAQQRTSPQMSPPPTLVATIGLLARLFAIIRPYWGELTKPLLLSLLAGLLGMAGPVLTKQYFDTVYPTQDFDLLEALVLAVAALGLATAMISSLRSYYSAQLGARLTGAVGLMYFNHLQHLPPRFFDEHRIGEVLSRLGDIRSALGSATRVLQTFWVNSIYVVLVPPFLLVINWKLAMIALVGVPLTVAITIVFGGAVRSLLKRSAESAAELNAMQFEFTSNVRMLKALAAEPAVFYSTRAQTECATRDQVKAAGMGTLVGLANSVVHVAGTAIYTWYAWTVVLRGELTIGGFVAFTAYLGYLTGPVNALAGLFSEFQGMAVSLARAFEYLDLPTEQDPERAFVPRPPLSQEIVGTYRLDSVSFGYQPNRLALDRVSVEFPRGKVTAIVGGSGAGKSSLLRLLCRFADASAGSVLLDGLPISEIPLSDLRRQVAVVWQEPTLMKGTILENLTFGLGDVERHRVFEAIRACQLTTFIEQLPLGIQTSLAESGNSISGGQRQRLSIARALLRNTPVLLLDEATSQLDVVTERELLKEVISASRGSTVIFVTHRLESARVADNIAVLDNGALVAFGPHAELEKTCPLYSGMLQRSPVMPLLGNTEGRLG